MVLGSGFMDGAFRYELLSLRRRLAVVYPHPRPNPRAAAGGSFLRERNDYQTQQPSSVVNFLKTCGGGLITHEERRTSIARTRQSTCNAVQMGKLRSSMPGLVCEYDSKGGTRL